MPTTWPWNEFVARNESRPGISTVERWRLIVHGVAADLEERERGRLLGVPERLGRCDLHRLHVGGGDAELAADDELYAREREDDDDRELRRVAEELDVSPPQQVPAGHAEHEEPARQETCQERVAPGKPHEFLGQDLEDVGRLGPAGIRVDLVPDRVLHP